MNETNPKPTIGWREWAALPELGIKRIKMKVDTGARTSCLHAFKIETFSKENEDWVRFWIHPLQKNTETAVCCEARIKDQRQVSDSGGHRELRYVIETPLLMNGLGYSIEITLTNRDNMKFRMLLGRTAINGHFVVDPSASFLTGKP